MNGSKVTVAYKTCQKKRVKCTQISPCTNCRRAGQRYEYTETAKKRGSRNGNVKEIKSPEDVPNLRCQVEQMLVHSNTRPAVHSARFHPVNNPVVITDDVTTDVSHSHGIPRSILMQDRYGHDTYSRDINVSVEPQASTVSLPPITELERQFSQDGYIFTQSRMISSTHNRGSRKKMAMPIDNLASEIVVLLPPAPDLENPLDSTTMLVDNPLPIKLPPLEFRPFGSG